MSITFAELCASNSHIQYQIIQLDNIEAPWRRSYIEPNMQNVALRSKGNAVHQTLDDWNRIQQIIHTNKDNYWVQEVSLP